MSEEDQDNVAIAFKGLLAQLYLPVYRIRLITAKKVAQLLEENKEQYQDTYLTWLSERTFENEVVSGLCILGLMKRDSLVDLNLVQSHIKKPSILSDMYLEMIYGITIDSISWSGQHSGAPKTDFREKYRVSEMSTNYVAPIFRNDLREWERRSGKPLLKQWAWEYENLEPLLKKYESHPSYFFDDFDRQNHSGHYHLRLADVFYSAYLRTLAYAISNWGMPLDLGTVLSANCIPLDFELAKVNPIKKPKKFTSFETDKQLVVQQSGLTEKLEEIINLNNEVLVAGSFPLFRTKLFSADMHIRSVLVDDKEPLVERVFEGANIYLPKEYMFHEWSKQDFVFDFMEKWDSGEDFSSAAFTLFPECFPRWQIEKINCGIFLPSPLMVGGLPEIEYQSNGMLFKVNDQTVARWIFWYDNWRTSHLIGLKEGVGTALLVNKEVLKASIQNTEHKLMVAAQVQSLSRQSEYGRLEKNKTNSQLISLK